MYAQNGGEEENTYKTKVQTVTNNVRNPVVYPVVQTVDIIKDKNKNKNKNKSLSPKTIEKREGDKVDYDALVLGKVRERLNQSATL